MQTQTEEESLKWLCFGVTRPPAPSNFKSLSAITFSRSTQETYPKLEPTSAQLQKQIHFPPNENIFQSKHLKWTRSRARAVGLLHQCVCCCLHSLKYRRGLQLKETTEDATTDNRVQIRFEAEWRWLLLLEPVAGVERGVEWSLYIEPAAGSFMCNWHSPERGFG